MTLRHRSLRTVAAGSVLGLAAGTAAVLGTTTPASAATFDVTCQVPILGERTFPVEITTDAPATVPAGAAPGVTALLTVPEEVAGAMRGILGIDEIAGRIVADAVVNGATVVDAITLDIARTDIGDAGPFQLTGTGAVPLVAPPGSYVIGTGHQDVSMTLFDLEGDPAGTPFEIPCDPAAGSDTTLGTVEVVQATSETATTAKYNAKKDKVVGKATVTPETEAAPTDGDEVTFLLKKGKKKVRATTVELRNGSAKVVFPKISKRGAYSLKATYRGSELVAGSSDKATFRVR